MNQNNNVLATLSCNVKQTMYFKYLNKQFIKWTTIFKWTMDNK